MDLNVQQIALEQLVPYAHNARTHSDSQVAQIAGSIAEFGLVNPVLVGGDNIIIAGHGRVMGGKELGWNEVLCLHVNDLSETEKRAYILADNKIVLNAGWDEEILAEELQYLTLEVPELDISVTGFSIAEINEVLNIGGVDAQTEGEEDDALPPTRFDKPSITQQGDIWQLGEHRLICGDALKDGTYQRLMGRIESEQAEEHLEKAQMAFTDPPYNVPIDGHVMGKGQQKHRELAIASGEMSSEEFTGFLTTSFEHMAKFSSNGSIHFICMDWRHMPEILSAGNAVYNELKTYAFGSRIMEAGYVLSLTP